MGVAGEGSACNAFCFRSPETDRLLSTRSESGRRPTV